MKTVSLAHGNGGVENAQLINSIFYKAFENDTLKSAEDSALIDGGRLAITTDSFTVSPLFFAGANIGKLAVCGTCNDLAMMGAKPKYLTCSVIIEEGFEVEQLEKIVESMREEVEKNGAVVVCGDTKVVPRGCADKIFINTTGVGEVVYEGLSSHNITSEDVIIVSRDIGTHGATIFTAREGIDMHSDLKSDCASLYPLVRALGESGVRMSALRDATRGGVSAVLNEWARASNVCIELDEQSIPVSDEVRGVCELLGFEAVNLANEGTFVLAVKSEDAQKAVEILRSFKEGQNASIIGTVTNQYEQKVILKTPWGTKRFLETPTGELLPRIC